MTDLIAWHGTQTEVPDPAGFTIRDPRAHRGGFHIGTRDQARERMHPRGSLIRVRIPAVHLARLPRLKDRNGDWGTSLKRHLGAGTPIVTYLNRHEGLGIDRVIELCAHDSARLEGLSDAAFRRLAPEACDSWIVLDPSIAVIEA